MLTLTVLEHLLLKLIQGWIQHDLVGGGGGCSVSSGAELCR